MAIHEEYCSNNKAVKIEMPDEFRVTEFKTHKRITVYADFESLVEPIDTCEPSSDESFTSQYQKHKPCGFCYHIVCFDDKLYSQEQVIYRAKSEDEDVAQIFVEMLEENIKKIHKEFDFAKKMIFTMRIGQSSEERQNAGSSMTHLVEKRR